MCKAHDTSGRMPKRCEERMRPLLHKNLCTPRATRKVFFCPRTRVPIRYSRHVAEQLERLSFQKEGVETSGAQRVAWRAGHLYMQFEESEGAGTSRRGRVILFVHYCDLRTCVFVFEPPLNAPERAICTFRYNTHTHTTHNSAQQTTHICMEVCLSALYACLSAKY